MTKKVGSGSVPYQMGEERFKYDIHNLDLTGVKLTDSPLDDYQRLYFATLLSDPNVDRRRNIDVRRVTYKSNIAESFLSPVLGIAQDAAVSRENDTAGARSQTKKVLDCFEYQLPDVNTAGSLGQLEISSLSETYRENLGLKGHPGQLLKGSIFTQEVDSVTGNAGLPAQAYVAREGDDKNANSLTKNQQFKIRKQDHSLQQNNRLINPNNCVLWTHGSGYVFLTGIWRLCQDVMRGLTSVPRLDHENSEELQNICKRQLRYLITSAFYESSSSPVPVNPTDRRKRRQSVGCEKSTTLSFQGNGSLSPSDSAGTASLNPHYTDLHWSSLSRELKQMMCDTYKSHLINERGFDPQHLAEIDYTEVIKRIRGGYIKIQGTWLPFETARLMCIRFCYPIRYLLVPIFGPRFPGECEQWYKGLQQRLLTFEKEQQRVMSSTHESQSQQRRRKKRDSLKSKVSKPVGNELSNAFQNLLDISKHPVPVQGQQMHARSKSLSCAPECAALMPRRTSSETLPPISTVMQFVSPTSSIGEIDDRFGSGNESENIPYGYGEPYPQRSGPSHPNPTVQTLSHLASFYNTHGHRYSYPGNIYMSHQKPVANRPSAYNPASYGPDYHAKTGAGVSSQDNAMGSEIPSYEPLQKPTMWKTEKWFPTSSEGGLSDELVSPKSTTPGQRSNAHSLISGYPDHSPPYFFNTTR